MTDRGKLSTHMAIQILGWVVSALLAYGAVNARVAVLESRMQDSGARMQRIEDKIDRIWEKVK